MRTISKTLIASAAFSLLALLSSCSKNEEADVRPEVTAQVMKIDAHDLRQHIVVDAVLYPRDQAAIQPKITAPVAKFYVQRGDHVKAGQLLAELQHQDLSAAVQESEGGLEQAQAGYSNTMQATIPEDVQKAQLDVAQARSNLSAQESIYNSRKTLFNEGAIAKKDLDAAQVAYVQAKSAFDIASQHLQSVQKVSESSAKQTAQGQLNAARGHYESAAAQLRYAEIRSPIAGVVTERNFFAGETPQPGTPLITVMDTSQVIAKAHIPQADASLIKVGDAADVIGIAGQPIPGKVALVSPALDPNSTTVEIWVTADNRNGALKPGAAAKIDIVSRSVRDALAVPRSAIVQGDKGPQLMFVGNDNIAHARSVTTGITDSEQDLVQVTSGARPGESIVADVAYGLPDGTKIDPAPSAGSSAASKPEAGDKD